MKKQDGGLTTARLLLSMANDNATRLQVVEDKVGLLMKDMSKVVFEDLPLNSNFSSN